MIRWLTAVTVTASLAVGGLLAAGAAVAEPERCPPVCDRIPASAWPAPAVLPLNGVYGWPALAQRATPVAAPVFRFNEWCYTPPRPDDPRSYAVAATAVVPQPSGQWQLQVQVLHWRGDTQHTGMLVDQVMRTAAVALRSCLGGAPPVVTTDRANRLAGVVTDPVRGVLRQYVAAHPRSGSLVELAMWSTSPPAVAWPAVDDAQLLDALVAPLCGAYVGSCR
ncbi:ATPase [Mycobacterium sp. MYCO198283]|uniref:ATPase n=1 Tax=Mycobacterium sp. MYCO198283 TaxID=2883505 RepID=UPI001E30615F|nr:ATPase [Mycobacterium sp. MYCO198283]MCG5431302.1 ATPase [Mycobacterium sp. MYCO198283]